MSYRSETTRKDPRVIFVSGPSNSGKTTLIERLIPQLRGRGIRVGTIKHAHDGFEVDHPGKDSRRHAQAGASAVTLISPRQMASFVQTQQEMRLAEAIDRMTPNVDFILVEGFKKALGPKILIEPNASYRLTIHHQVCGVGVFPNQLSPEEIEQIVQFCGGR